MRRSHLLLVLVAGAAADAALLKRSVGQNSILKSREPTDNSRSLEARLPLVDVGKRGVDVLKSWLYKRDDDDDDNDDYHNSFDFLHNSYEEDHDHDDNDNPGGPGDLSGGEIAGAVVGSLVLLTFILGICYFVCIRPRRKQSQMLVARKEAELEEGYGMSPVSSIHNATPQQEGRTENEHIRFAPSPYPRRVPSIGTESSMSGLALPTPALTYSPSATTSASPSLPPSPPHATTSEKPPAYMAIAALQSSEPQPEASAYQMGQVPVASEPPTYHLPIIPQTGVVGVDGEHIPRY
ncbi:hypothetical protein F5Y13DRAFT_135743 [Hypoxylon sp. FL1857]|nr:hypothetical protein F5Y13DRAFT_135743 [Hypoxylon sp. FL1857]